MSETRSWDSNDIYITELQVAELYVELKVLTNNKLIVFRESLFQQSNKNFISCKQMLESLTQAAPAEVTLWNINENYYIKK